MCVRKAWYQKKQTENQPVVRNSWAVIPCKFGVYHTCEYEMLSLKFPSSFAFSATGASVKWCVCKSVLADTFKCSIYMVQTGAELNLLPVCQHQGILWCQAGASPVARLLANRSHDSVTSKLVPSGLTQGIPWPCVSAGLAEVTLSHPCETEGLTNVSGLAPGKPSSSSNAACEFLWLLFYKKRLPVL